MLEGSAAGAEDADEEDGEDKVGGGQSGRAAEFDLRALSTARANFYGSCAPLP